MGSAEDYLVCNSDIDKKRIEEIDLAMLARYFRILDRFVNSEDIAAVQKNDDDEELLNTSIKSRLLDFLICNNNSHYYIERQIALRMMFDSILAAPKHIADVERMLGLQFTDTENE